MVNTRAAADGTKLGLLVARRRGSLHLSSWLRKSRRRRQHGFNAGGQPDRRIGRCRGCVIVLVENRIRPRRAACRAHRGTDGSHTSSSPSRYLTVVHEQRFSRAYSASARIDSSPLEPPAIPGAPSETRRFRAGTKSSNPSPSSGESDERRHGRSPFPRPSSTREWPRFALMAAVLTQMRL